MSSLMNNFDAKDDL